MVDLIIIGAGPAGLTAAIYGARAGLKTLIFEVNEIGGQVSQKDRVENYPGFPNGIKGGELMQSFLQQALNFGAEFHQEKVLKVKTSESNHQVETDRGTYEAHAVIIATGLKHRKLGVPGEALLAGKGVSYCVTSDGSLYMNKKAVVVGGGSTAIEEALLLAQSADEVILVHRRNRLKAEAALVKRAEAEPKIRFIWNSVVTAIEGDTQVSGVRIKDNKTQAETWESCAGVFICIGRVPNSAFVGNSVPLNEDGYILTNAWMATELPGIYAAGDVRKKAFRQISTAVGDGTEGALAAQHYISNL